jgi:radical SAM superfamily enzyme YgiQ (UPF0313 family)
MVFPSGGDVIYTHFNFHLGSAYIIAYVREHGFNAEQFISNETFNVKECVKRIVEFSPKIVGFTVYEKNYMQCVLISNGLKSYNPNLITIFGGPTPTVQSREIMETNSSVDICVKQEGEETVLKLLSAFSKVNYNQNQVDLYNIKSITFRKANRVVTTPESNILFSNRSVKNFLDKYPSPYLSNIIPISSAYPVGIITARGCNQNCIYCNCAVLSKRNLYLHSIERVIEELKLINEHKEFLGPIPVYDDGFTIIPERAKRICEAIIENDINLPLLCATRCDKITKELLDLMKQAGFEAVGFSLESAVPKVLRAIGKVTPPGNLNSDLDKEIDFINRFKEMTSYAKKIGIKSVFVSIMIGLPGESIQDAQKTIKFINKLKIDDYSHNILHIFKGTPIYQNSKKYGYEIKPIGHRNNIILKNNYPFDVNKVKFGKKCSKIVSSKVADYETLKTLSFNLKRINQKSFFDKVIINSDVIKPSLVKWLQENLAINGAIIHIHSNKGRLLKLQQANIKTLYDNFSPTMDYQSYYWKNFGDTSILHSAGMIYDDEQIGFPIKLESTYSGLKEYYKGNNDMRYTICQDQETSDTKALYDLLIKISKSKNSFKYLLNRKPLPHFQCLCRWTGNQANCLKMETAIIGLDNSIRICWHSDPIGEIGISFPDIKQNLENSKKKIVDSRKCNRCIQNKNCLKCLFPFPLSSEEYCSYKNTLNAIEPARMLNVFYRITDFFVDPISYLDY